MDADIELIRRTYEAFGCGNIPTVLDNLADDVQWSAPRTLPQGGQFQGRADSKIVRVREYTDLDGPLT